MRPYLSPFPLRCCLFFSFYLKPLHFFPLTIYPFHSITLFEFNTKKGALFCSVFCILVVMGAAGEVFRQNFPEELEESPSGGVRELHVLAVDDSLVDRKVIERLLKISSCKVTVVDSGTRALQYLGLDGEKSSLGFDSVNVNLIITDYSMPGMTGYELLKRIKESSVFREIPVVIMSSENILTRIDRCLEEGAEEFLLKPVKLSDVRRLKDFIMRGEVKESEKRISHKRMRPDEISPPMTHPYDPSPSPSSSSSSSSDLSPLSPSTMSSKKSRL